MGIIILKSEKCIYNFEYKNMSFKMENYQRNK